MMLFRGVTGMLACGVGCGVVAGTAVFAQCQEAPMQRTFIAIKPDGVQRGLIAPIIQRFEQRGFKLVAMKMVTPTLQHAETHYADLSSKPFYGGLTRYLASGPVVAMVWEGKDVIATGRKLIGATNPLLSEPGTIRGDYCIELGRNIIHGSDSQESAAAEIKLWFTDAEISNWTQANKPWIYE